MIRVAKTLDMIQEYQNCCRLCLSTDQNHMLPNIFGQDVTEKMIAPKILYCYSLFIYPQDPFSKQLCLRCLFNLEQLWTFKQKCHSNHSKLLKSLSSDPSIKHSDQYVKSINNASKTTTMHALLSCNSPEEVARLYYEYESLIEFSWKENVELIDICSDEEDNKEIVRLQIQQSTMMNADLREMRLNLNHDGPPNSLSTRRSISSDFSDDAYSTFSDRTTSSRSTDRNTSNKKDGKRKQCLLSREQRSLGIDLNSNLESLPKTRKRQNDAEKEVPAESKVSDRTGLRSLRPLLNKNSKTVEPPSQRRSRSRSRDNDADSFGSRDSLNTIGSNSLTSSRKQDSGTKSSDVSTEKTSETGNENQKLNGKFSNGKRTRGENEEKGSIPSSKKRKTSESQDSGTSSMAVPSPVTENPIKRYNCKYCDKKFKYKIDKKQHVKKCPLKKIINCKHCSKRLYREEDLYKHHLIHVTVDMKRLPRHQHQCNVCNKYFFPTAALKKHEKLHRSLPAPEMLRVSPRVRNEKPQEKVPISSSEESDDDISLKDLKNSSTSNDKIATARNDPNRRDFRNNRTRATKVDLPLGSKECAVKQPESKGLNMETSKEYVNNFCKYCSQVFEDAGKLWKHMQAFHKLIDVDSPMKPDSSDSNSNHKCSYENCHKKFPSLKDLVLHWQVHIPLKCHHCEYFTNKFSSFLHHECRNQKNSEKLNRVNCCNINFTKAYDFYFHKIYRCELYKMSLDTTDDRECGICSENVGPSSGKLLVHLVRHAHSNFNPTFPILGTKQMNSGQDVFMKILNLCPKDTSKENKMDSFECSECQNWFLSLQAFQEHKKKCFILSCTKCKLTFKNNHDFIAHKCVVRCKVCLTRLGSSRHVCLVRKILVHQTSKKYKCLICNTVLPNLICGRKHIFKHFPNSSASWLENIKCKICAENMSNQLTLDVHYHLKHPTSDQPVLKPQREKNEGKLPVDTRIIDNQESSKNTIQVDLKKGLSDSNGTRLETNQSSSKNGSEKLETKTSSTEVDSQTPLSLMPADALPNSDKEVEINHVTPVKQKNCTSPINIGLSSPNYKVGDKDWSWIVCSPVSKNSISELNPSSS